MNPTQNNPKEKQTPEQKQAQRRAESAAPERKSASGSRNGSNGTAAATPTYPPTYGTRQRSSPITVTFSPETAELLQWYFSVTKHFAEDTAEGVVHGRLSQAKKAHEEAPWGDDAFDFVLEDVLEAKSDDRVCRLGYEEGFPVQLDAQASEAVFYYSRLTKTERRDVVNGAITAELARVVEMIVQKGPGDDGLGVMADHVAAAGRRRRGEEAPDAPVVLSDLPEDERIPAFDPMAAQPCSVNLGPEARKAMNRLQGMFPTVEEGDFLRVALEGTLNDCLEDASVAGVVAGQALHLAEQGSSAFLWEGSGENVAFVVPEGENPADFRHLGVAANRGGMVLAAAGKPLQPA